MGTKKLILIFAAVVLLISGVAGYAAYTAALTPPPVSLYDFSGEVFIAEKGFDAAEKYANSIFSEFYCNKTNEVYADVVKSYDITKKYLAYALFTSNEYNNRLLLIYKMPKKQSEEDISNNYATSYTSVTIELSNIVRDDKEIYHCNDFYIYTDNTSSKSAIDEVFKENAAKIESDSVIRRLIDYGVLYCDDLDFYTRVFDKEYGRINSYLLSVQKDAAESYHFSTAPSENNIDNQQAAIDDVKQFFAEGEDTSISNNKVDYETGVDDIFSGHIYRDYKEYNEKLRKEKAEAAAAAEAEANSKK